MTDIMKLADNYITQLLSDVGRQYGLHRVTATTDGKARAALQYAVEAMQGENEQLTKDIQAELYGNLALRKKHGAKDGETMFAFIERIVAERDALAAELAGLKKQEPVGFVAPHDLKTLREGYPATVVMLAGAKRTAPLYAAPKALAPEKGTELFDAWCDKSYADGMLLGWNLCESNHPETFQQLRSTRTEAAIKVILANRAAIGIGGTPC